MNKYDIFLKAEIQTDYTVEADSREQAIEIAKENLSNEVNIYHLIDVSVFEVNDN